MKKETLFRASTFSLAMLFISLLVACSGDSTLNGGQSSTGDGSKVSCELLNGTCLSLDKSACLELVENGQANLLAQCPAGADGASSASAGGQNFEGGAGSCEQLAVGESVALDAQAFLEIYFNLSYSKAFATGMTSEDEATGLDIYITKAQNLQIIKRHSYTQYEYQFGGNRYNYKINSDGSEEYHFLEGESSDINTANEQLEMIQNSKTMFEFEKLALEKSDMNLQDLRDSLATRPLSVSRDADGCILNINHKESNVIDHQKVYFKNDVISATEIIFRSSDNPPIITRPATAAEVELPAVFDDLEAFAQKTQENM
jgi:hypothetical protein